MDSLKNTRFMEILSGDVFLCQYDAYMELKSRIKREN